MDVRFSLRIAGVGLLLTASGCSPDPSPTPPPKGATNSTPSARPGPASDPSVRAPAPADPAAGGPLAAPEPMPLDAFWAIITHARGGPDNTEAAFNARAAERLAALSERDLAAFYHRFDLLHAAAYQWDLWGAASLLHGGCGDDSFIDFRKWVIACGRAVYETALRDPDSLADARPFDPTDNDPDGRFFEGIFEGCPEPPEESRLSHDSTHEPAGEPWDENDEAGLRRRFPRIAALVDRMDRN